MHRHGYKGRKFGRERDQRRALLKGLADSLIKYESIETTLPKAKEVVPYVEVLITKAKRGDLSARRQIISSLQTKESAHKLVVEIAPKLLGRTSGHLRITRTALRRGVHAQLAKISFVDDLKSAPVAKPAAKAAATAAKPGAASSAVARKPAAKTTSKPTRKTPAKMAKESK
jgi:large subunit ribosomal protein L17